MRSMRKSWSTVLAAALATVIAFTPAAAVKAATAEEVWAAAKATGQTTEDREALPDSYGTYATEGNNYIYYREDGVRIAFFPINPSWLPRSGGDGLSAEQAIAVEAARQREEAAAVAEAANIANSTLLNGLRSTVDGSYYARSVGGVAVKTPKELITVNLQLLPGESAYISTWDIARSESPDAMRSLQAGADSVNGTIGATLQINISKVSPGQGLVPLDPKVIKGTLEVTLGIPQDLREIGGEIALVRVVSGGDFEILRDLDKDAYTFTANLPVGESAYALICLPKQ